MRLLCAACIYVLLYLRPKYPTTADTRRQVTVAHVAVHMSLQHEQTC